jgi:hypothetical protein
MLTSDVMWSKLLESRCGQFNTCERDPVGLTIGQTTGCTHSRSTYNGEKKTKSQKSRK